MGLTVSCKALRAPILAAAVRTGEPMQDLAMRVGVSSALVGNPDGRVEHAVVTRAWELLADRAGDPHLGLFAAELLEAAPVDLVDLALGQARDLRGMTEAYLRFQRLFHEANESTLLLEGEATVACFRLRGMPRCRHLSEFVLGSWTRRMRRGVGAAFALREVRLCDSGLAGLAHDPFARVFGTARLRFGADQDALVFDAALLERPLEGASDELRGLLEQQVELALVRTRPDLAFVDRVRLQLRGELGRGSPQLPQAPRLARALAVSTRSLQRRLAEAGTTFRQVVDEVRRDLALDHLQQPGTSVTDVAFVLGFADLSSFCRAFRRWTGRSPEEHRASASGA